MKLKGLAAAIKSAVDMQEIVNDKIDVIEVLDQDGSPWELKDRFLNDAWTELDAAIEALRRVEEMKLEDCL